MFHHAVVFFKEFIRHPQQLGTAVSSSVYMKKCIVEAADLADAKVIVELGPGHGGTTRAILQQMSSDARLLSIELNEHLYALNCQIKDTRYIAYRGDARDLEEILAKNQLQQPDVVISGIPFSTIGEETGAQILQAIYTHLSPNGRFVAYQLSGLVEKINRVFPYRHCRVKMEWRNIPPLRIWCWVKGGV